MYEHNNYMCISIPISQNFEKLGSFQPEQNFEIPCEMLDVKLPTDNPDSFGDRISVR